MLQSLKVSASRNLLTSPLVIWLVLQIPVFAALHFLYTHRPVADPTAVNYDVKIYFDAATAALRGQLPYRDFFFQYPPFALPFYIWPRLFAPTLSSYFVWFNVELLILSGIGLMASATIVRRLRQPLGPTLLCYSIGLLALGSIVPQRYDLIPAVVVTLALAAWLNDRREIAWALLALGTLTKIYPALLFPLFTVAAWRVAKWREVERGWLVFGLVALVAMLPFLAFAPGDTFKALVGQAERGFEIESTFALLMLAGRALGLPAEIVYQKQLNSWDVTSSYAAPLTLLAVGLQTALLIFAYVRFLGSSNHSGVALIRYSALVIALGLLTSKVFSPQYMIWLFPLALLTGRDRFVWTCAFFLISALFTQIVFPSLWGALKQGEFVPVLLLLVRDLGLVALCILLIQEASPTESKLVLS